MTVAVTARRSPSTTSRSATTAPGSASHRSSPRTTYADDLHLVSHQNGMHAVLRLIPPGTGRATADRVEATPALLAWSCDGGRDRARLRGADTVRLRGRGPRAAAVAAARRTLTPFSGTYLYRDPVDGAHVFTSYETGRRYRITVLAGAVADASASRRSAPPSAASSCRRRRPWEVAVEEYETARAALRAPRRLRRGRDGGRGRVRGLRRRRSPPGATRATPGRRARRLRPVVGHRARRPASSPGPAVLMSKHWMDKVWSWDHCFNALALAAGAARAGLGPVPAPLRPPGRQPAPCPTRSPTPRSSTTSSNRPSTAGLSATCADACRAARPGRAGRGLRPAGALDRLLAHRPPRPRRSRCPTTSTATTAAGTTPPPSTPNA